jgi:hypothetical protein
MRLLAGLALLTLVLAGCQTVDNRHSLRPLPDEGPPLPYAELLTRARAQASLATEAFYVNRWPEIEDAARGLDQTARYLGRAEDIPPRQKEALPNLSRDLATEAANLRLAAQKMDDKEVTQILQRINLKVRELRLDQ